LKGFLASGFIVFVFLYYLIFYFLKLNFLGANQERSLTYLLYFQDTCFYVQPTGYSNVFIVKGMNIYIIKYITVNNCPMAIKGASTGHAPSQVKIRIIFT
jgi:hypothetical protein